MVQLSVEHLSGARRGEVDALTSLPVAIGSGPAAQVLVPEAAPLHARILREGERFLLHDGGSGQATLLAGAAVHQVALHDGDILELGAGGPRLRFHCDEVRSHGLRRLLEHRDFRIALALVLLAGAALVGWTYHLNSQVARLQLALLKAEAERRDFQQRVEEERRRAVASRESLESRIEDSRRREEDLRRRLGEAARGGEARTLQGELEHVRSRLLTLEGERAAGERIIRRYGGGVCLIQGAYAFYDGQGRPLRYRVDKSGEKVREPDGSVAVDVQGQGPVHSVDAIGTGFLADRRGLILTNRHLAEPWWKNDAAAALAKQGYKARLLALRAYFPGVSEPLKVEVRRVSHRVDLAVLAVDLKGRKIPALPLDSGSGAVPGQPVVVLGYPTGLEAILAKTETRVVEEILSAQGTSTERITEALSRRRLIRPSTTQGHIGDVTATDVVFDAATTQGGSGGPVFNKDGRVIAVEYAVLPQFAGNSYGVPMRYALGLLRGRS
jgi:S1-C subfamily serine protease